MANTRGYIRWPFFNRKASNTPQLVKYSLAPLVPLTLKNERLQSCKCLFKSLNYYLKLYWNVINLKVLVLFAVLGASSAASYMK